MEYNCIAGHRFLLLLLFVQAYAAFSSLVASCNYKEVEEELQCVGPPCW